MSRSDPLDFKTEIQPLLQILLRRLFDIREGEALRASLMLCYIFLIIASLMIVKPVAIALFLSEFGATHLPIAFILIAVCAAAVATLYSRLLRKMRLASLISRTLKLAIGSLLVFWAFLYFNRLEGGILYVFYIWVAIFAVIAASQFWILANLIFNAREAKRLFGFIGSGAIAGGIFGGYITKFLAPVIGSENLIFVGIAFLTLCIQITKTVWKSTPRSDQSYQFQQQKRITAQDEHPLKAIRASRHLTFLATIVGIGVVAARLVEYQFSAVASAQIGDEDRLTAFFGFWLSNLNIASLLIQLFVTPRVVGVFGVGTSLFFLPIGILLGATAILVHPALWTAILVKISDGSLKNSINKAGIELLALPIPSQIKHQAKSFIDVFVDSFATGIGGALLLMLTLGLGFTVQHISVMLIALICGWIYLVFQIRREYIESFRLKIERSSEEASRSKIDFRNKSVLGGFIEILDEGRDVQQILTVLNLVKEIQSPLLISCFKKLLRHSSAAIRLAALENLYFYKHENFAKEARELVNDQSDDVKAEAIEYLFRHAKEPMSLVESYLHHEDYRIRGAALLCAARESRKNQQLKTRFRIHALVEENVTQIPQMSSEEQKEFTKINCAKVIGEANIAELYPYLHIFLNATTPSVLEAAIVGAARTGQYEFVDIIIQHLANPTLRMVARKALTSYRAEIIDTLVSYLDNPATAKSVRLAIPKTIAAIGSQEAANVLIRNLEQTDSSVRYQVIKALNRLKKQAPHLTFDQRWISNRVMQETRDYMDTLVVLYAQLRLSDRRDVRSNDHEIAEARGRLIKALEQELDEHLERIFRLLGLRYPPDDIYNAYLGIQKSNPPDLRANAVEFLDNLLEPDLKKVIVPIIETTVVDALIDETLEKFDLDVLTEFECLVRLLSGDDDILKASALRLIAHLREDKYLPYLGKLIDSPNATVKEMARFALMKMGIYGKTAAEKVDLSVS